jgi:hypothetical protein
MKEIGGYFELELSKKNKYYHDTPYRLKSGRSSLQYILNAIKPSLIHIPYYTCDTLLEPFDAAGIDYKFYRINEHLEPENTIELNKGEYFLYINYFDLKRDAVERLSERYKDKLLVDCTQAFFMKGNGVSWFFNSCRKFFGVPDGSFMYCPTGMELPVIETKNEDYIVEHLLKRFNGHTNEGYMLFQQNEILVGKGINGMSKLSEYLLSEINCNEIIEKRRSNYEVLHKQFKTINAFAIATGKTNVPMCYPLLLNKGVNKSDLFKLNIFIPTIWKDTHNRGMNGFEFEKEFTDRLWPLPIDHRYSLEDMELLYSSIAGIL